MNAINSLATQHLLTIDRTLGAIQATMLQTLTLSSGCASNIAASADVIQSLSKAMQFATGESGGQKGRIKTPLISFLEFVKDDADEPNDDDHHTAPPVADDDTDLP